MHQMKHLKTLFISGFMLCLPFALLAQGADIIGTWQLVKQTSCLEETASGAEEDAAGLRKAPSDGVPSGQLVRFKNNASGEESARILNSARTANAKRFYYKFNGDMLLILDKKSQTISDSYMVDKFTPDSLIISNSSRPCEVRIFVKINEEQPN